MQELTPQNPFGAMVAAQGGANVGAIAIESERAIAQARGQIQIAKMFPRSMAQATAEFMEACKSREFAASAFYTVPNRGTGPSIRFMEEAARCYGNFQYGHRELSRSEGKSEVEVFAWDVERNNHRIRQVSVLHVRDTRDGPKPLRDQADIDARVANVASKQMRGCMSALLPKALIAAGIEACMRTIDGNNDQPISERVQAMVAAFTKNFGVTAAHLTTYLGHALDGVTLDELTELIGVFNALREGTAKVDEYFVVAQQADPTAAAITAVISSQATALPPATPAAAPPATPRQRRTTTTAAAVPSPAPDTPPPAATPTNVGVDEVAKVGISQGSPDFDQDDASHEKLF